MTPERWRHIKHLCELALEHEPEERAAFLTQVCAADSRLRADVDGLLQHATANGDAFDSPIWDQMAIAPSPEFSATGGAGAPQQVGRYRIIGVLGEGGMGTVYEAEQDAPRRSVALKLDPRRRLASRDILRRFEQEAQVLGRLQHPGIAQVYEAGTADTGFGSQPYFAMEFIERPAADGARRGRTRSTCTRRARAGREGLRRGAARPPSAASSTAT